MASKLAQWMRSSRCLSAGHNAERQSLLSQWCHRRRLLSIQLATHVCFLDLVRRVLNASRPVARKHKPPWGHAWVIEDKQPVTIASCSSRSCITVLYGRGRKNSCNRPSSALTLREPSGGHCVELQLRPVSIASSGPKGPLLAC
jgi:hypothetical protein